jgi:hypothetical protein
MNQSKGGTSLVAPHAPNVTSGRSTNFRIADVIEIHAVPAPHLLDKHIPAQGRREKRIRLLL